MFYYIIPPIIIIISFSVLIYFLFRKISEVPSSVIASKQIEIETKPKSAITAHVGQISLKLLERIMHRTKLLSLKFHNVSNQWFHLIRKKRQKHLDDIANEAAEKQESLIEEFNNKQATESIAAPTAIARKRRVEDFQMVSKHVVHPQSKQIKAEAKNQLEEALIKRIAINPRDIEAYERLGDYYFDMQSFGDAMECFKQVTKLSPAHNKARMKIRKIERMLN